MAGVVPIISNLFAEAFFKRRSPKPLPSKATDIEKKAKQSKRFVGDPTTDLKNKNLVVQKQDVNENVCQSLLQTYISEYSKSYPMKIGEEYTEQQKNQMVLFLARKYMKDFKSQHCINLPAEMFQLPWEVNVESDFLLL